MPWAEVEMAVGGLVGARNRLLREPTAHDDIAAALSSIRPDAALAFLLLCGGTRRRGFLPNLVALLPTISDHFIELLLESLEHLDAAWT